MDKLLPLLALIVTTSISIGGPVLAEGWFAGPSSSSFVTGPDAAVVLVAGKGGGGTTGGMGGGATTGGMGGGATTGGMGGGATTGGMGGGATTGGMGGGASTGGMGGGGATTGGMGGGGASTGGLGGGGMFNNPPPSFGANSSDWPGSSTQSSYYTYQCVTAAGQCSFVAPASLRSSSLRAGARCSCSNGLSQGQIK
jgi:hypothetical protein